MIWPLRDAKKQDVLDESQRLRQEAREAATRADRLADRLLEQLNRPKNGTARHA